MPAPGELIPVNGSHFHVQRCGHSAAHTILLETGLTMMSACWGWLAPELAKFANVVSYDRAGLGWSEERMGLRDARQIAEELTALTKTVGLRENVVLLGHSMGAMFNRAFLRQNPGFASGLVWLDPAHPDQLPRSRRMQTFFFLLEFAHLLASRNLPSITLRIVPHLKDLPERDYHCLRAFLKNARHLKNTALEARAWKQSADYARGAELGATPLLVISAQKNALGHWVTYQQELAGLSSKARHVTFTDVSHLSMLSHREHATRAAAQIQKFVAGL